MCPLGSSLVMDMLGLSFSCGYFKLKGDYDGKNETSSRVPGISVPNTGSKRICKCPNSWKVSTKELCGPIKQIQIQLLLNTLYFGIDPFLVTSSIFFFSFFASPTDAGFLSNVCLLSSLYLPSFLPHHRQSHVPFSVVHTLGSGCVSQPSIWIFEFFPNRCLGSSVSREKMNRIEENTEDTPGCAGYLLSAWHKVESFSKMEPQLESHLSGWSVCKSVGAFSWLITDVGLSWSSVGGITLGQVPLGVYKKLSWESMERASKQLPLWPQFQFRGLGTSLTSLSGGLWCGSESQANPLLSKSNAASALS